MRALLIPMTLLLLAGCSGTKVTSKASSQVGKYPVRTIALIPFETMATPQAIEASGPAFPVPSGARRSDMAVGVPPTTDQAVRQTHRVPASAGEKVTDLMWAKLKARSGLQLLSPNESARVAREVSGGTATETMPATRLRNDSEPMRHSAARCLSIRNESAVGLARTHRPPWDSR